MCAESDDEMDVPDITPRTKKGKRKSSEELDFSGSLGWFNLFYNIYPHNLSFYFLTVIVYFPAFVSEVL